MDWSPGFRFFVVGTLALLMFVPLFFVGAIIDDRAGYARDSVASVSGEWGGAQTLAGPRLVIPVQGPVTRQETVERRDPVTRNVTIETVERTEIGAKAPLYVYPDRFAAHIRTESGERRRGIFRVPVYTAALTLGFDFDLSDARLPVATDETVLWDQARLEIGLNSNRALRGEAALEVDGTAVALTPGTGFGHRQSGGIAAALGDPRQARSYALRLGFNGAQSLFVAPVGRTSQIEIASDWPHPSFSGAFLPDGSEVSDQGFTANWTIPHLARPLPNHARSDTGERAVAEALGVRFFQPNDFYQKAYRAARYGILFIALTFLTVLLVERRGTHPVQYLLIGLAQSVFVVLMVAYAEQIGFGPAYALASAATVALLTGYGSFGLKLGRRAWLLGAMLTVLYTVLYVILQSADHALLAGATLAFLALAGTMYATRNEDWFGKPRPERGRGWFGRGAGAAAPIQNPGAAAPDLGAPPTPQA